MFPAMRVKIAGLDPHQQYYIAMDIVPVDNKRYRYFSSHMQECAKKSGILSEQCSRNSLKPDITFNCLCIFYYVLCHSHLTSPLNAEMCPRVSLPNRCWTKKISFFGVFSGAFNVPWWSQFSYRCFSPTTRIKLWWKRWLIVFIFFYWHETMSNVQMLHRTRTTSDLKRAGSALRTSFSKCTAVHKLNMHIRTCANASARLRAGRKVVFSWMILKCWT